MTIRNFLKAGDFVTVMPVGIPLTIQYDVDGNLQSAYFGVDSNTRKLISREDFDVLYRSEVCPHKIDIRKGTSWVIGVLYTDEYNNTPGQLFECVTESYWKQFIQKPETFRFFAATVSCNSLVFRGANNIRQWLNMHKFNVLPGFIMPYGVDFVDKLHQLQKSSPYTFTQLSISMYLVSTLTEESWIPSGYHQHTIKDIKKYTNNLGQIKLKLTFTDAMIMHIDYGEGVVHNLSKGSSVVYTSDNNIVEVHSDKIKESLPSVITCEFCGRQIFADLTPNGVTSCEEYTCTSRLSGHIQRFMTVLNIPTLTDEVYSKYIKAHKLLCIPDIFVLDEYKDTTVICSLFQLLRALVPYEVVSKDEILKLFVNGCTNNTKQLIYYVTHPESIATDLGLTGNQVTPLIEWLSHPFNVSDISTLLSISNIKLSDTDKVFEGVPMFRGKTICITGEFKRGTSAHIISVLNSYSAQAVTSYTDLVDCVITGSTMTDIDTSILHRAKDNKIPVYEEDDFFHMYDIDTDLRENLL